MQSSTVELFLLSEQLGLNSDTEFRSFQWFLKMLVQIPLPAGWSKLHDEESDTLFYHYFDETQKQTSISKIHPLINAFKGVLKEYLSKKSAPSDNSSMISRRVSSKPVLNSPAIVKKSKVNRLYCPENSYPLYEEGPGKKRFLTLKQELVKSSESESTQDFRLCELEESENLLEKYKIYFLEKYGDDIMGLSKKTKVWPGYLEVDLDDLLANLEFLTINNQDDYLFFIARIFTCLELPPDWQISYIPLISTENIRKKETGISDNKEYIEKERVFIWKNQGIYTITHPGFKYIEHLIAKAKKLEENEKNQLKKMAENMNFKEKMNRVFSLNLKELLLQNREINPEDPQENDPEKTSYSDDYILEIARQLELDLKKELHLLNIIHEFLMAKAKRQNEWTHKRVSKGQIYWINHSQRKAINVYPFISELKPIIENFRREIGIEYGKYIFEHQEKESNNYDDIIRFFKLKKIQDVILISRKEANGFIREYLEKSVLLKSEFKYTANYLKKYLKNTKNMSKDDVQNIIFHTPFDIADDTKDYSSYPENSNDGLAIKFVDNSLPRLIEKPVSNFLEKLDEIEDFENQELQENTMSLTQIEERESDLMNNVILVIIERKYTHLSESVRKRLFDSVEEDIRLILPYLINILDSKNDSKHEEPKEEKDEKVFVNSLREIFEDSEKTKEYNKKLLKTLEYKYFDTGLEQMFADFHKINFSLIRKINRFIFHKYREIILREFITDEDLDRWLEISDNEENEFQNKETESEISETKSEQIQNLKQEEEDDKNEETSSHGILASMPTITISKNESFKDIVVPSVVATQNHIERSAKFNENSQARPNKKFTYLTWEGQKKLEKNHFMKQLVRMTMEEKKIRRRFAELMKRNPTSENRLKKDFNDYTLEELKEAISGLEKFESEAKKEKERIRKAKAQAKILAKKAKIKKNLDKKNKTLADKLRKEEKKRNENQKVKKLNAELVKKKEAIKEKPVIKINKILKKISRRNSVSVDMKVKERIKNKLDLPLKRTSLEDFEEHKKIGSSLQTMLKEADSFRKILNKKVNKHFILPHIIKKSVSQSFHEIPSARYKEKTIAKLPEVVKKHSFLKRTRKPIFFDKSPNHMKKSSSLSHFSNESVDDLKVTEQKIPKKVPIEFKFATKDLFSDFYDYSEKNPSLKGSIGVRNSSAGPLKDNLKGKLINFEGISRNNEPKTKESRNNEPKTKDSVFRKFVKKRSKEVLWADIIARLEKKEHTPNPHKKDRKFEDVLKEVFRDSHNKLKDSQRKMPDQIYVKRPKEDLGNSIKLEESYQSITSSANSLKKIVINSQKNVFEREYFMSGVKVLREKHTLLDLKSIRQKLRPILNPIITLKSIENRKKNNFAENLTLGITDRSGELSPISEETASRKRMMQPNFKKKFIYQTPNNNSPSDNNREAFSPINIRGFKNLEPLSSRILIEEKSSILKEKMSVFNDLGNSRDSLKPKKLGNLVKGVILMGEKKESVLKKIETNFEIKGNKLGEKKQLEKIVKKIEKQEKKSVLKKKRLILRKKTKSLCEGDDYFKQFKIEYKAREWFFHKSF